MNPRSSLPPFVRTFRLGPLVVIAAAIVACSGAGATSDMIGPDPQTTSSGNEPEASGASEIPSAVADAGLDAPANTIADAARDAKTDASPSPTPSCAAGTKRCGSQCVKIDDPAFGCGAITCSPCASGPRSTPACSAGACALRCSGAFLDCDKNPTNGCEVNGDTDTRHCGDCSNACFLGDSCNRGLCMTPG